MSKYALSAASISDARTVINEPLDFRSLDRRLRDFDFQIHARPANQPPLWTRGLWHPGCRIYTQSEALAIIRDEVKRTETAGK